MAATNSLHPYLVHLLRPVIRFCYKRALSLNDLIEVAKHVFIDVSIEEMEREGHKINQSRISASTGVHRKDVARIFKREEVVERTPKFASRIIEVWRRDSKYLTKSRRPRVLSYRGEDSEFTQLVYSLTRDVHPASVIFDLERVGAVQRTKNGLKLTVRSYHTNEPEEAYQLLSEDVEDLMMAVTENIESEEEELPNYHAKVFYDNLPLKDMPRLSEWLFDQCLKFQERIARHLSKYDLDVNPDAKKQGGGRLMLGIFTRQSDNPEDEF